MKSNRKLLGFEDSSEDEDQPVVNTPKHKKLKLPKLTLEEPEAKQEEASDIEDERPTFSISKAKDAKLEDVDYLKMAIVENDKTKPQKLLPSGSRSSQIQSISKEDKLKTSLFGEINNDTGIGNPIMKILPNEQLLTKSKSKGLSIMEKMGFQVGDTLGKDTRNKDALLEPLIAVANTKRTGLKENKKTVVNPENSEIDTDSFRVRLNDENTEARTVKIIHKMQKYCFEFSGDVDQDLSKLDPLDVNVLWREYIIVLQHSFEKRKLKEDYQIEEVEESDDEDDVELSLFQQLSAQERLTRLNLHLRSEYDFCFFCGVRYDGQDDLFANCPGQSEQDHE